MQTQFTCSAAARSCRQLPVCWTPVSLVESGFLLRKGKIQTNSKAQSRPSSAQQLPGKSPGHHTPDHTVDEISTSLLLSFTEIWILLKLVCSYQKINFFDKSIYFTKRVTQSPTHLPQLVLLKSNMATRKNPPQSHHPPKNLLWKRHK